MWWCLVYGTQWYPFLWQYLRYWWNKVNFSSTTIIDRLYYCSYMNGREIRRLLVHLNWIVHNNPWEGRAASTTALPQDLRIRIQVCNFRAHLEETLTFIQHQHMLAVFSDVEKAYDTTQKNGIMKDLHEMDLRGKPKTSSVTIWNGT